MINLAVINIKDILKICKLIGITVLVVIIVVTCSIKINKDEVSFKNIDNLFLADGTRIIDETILISDYLGDNYSEKENRTKKNFSIRTCSFF